MDGAAAMGVAMGAATGELAAAVMAGAAGGGRLARQWQRWGSMISITRVAARHPQRRSVGRTWRVCPSFKHTYFKVTRIKMRRL